MGKAKEEIGHKNQTRNQDTSTKDLLEKCQGRAEKSSTEENRQSKGMEDFVLRQKRCQ